MDGYHPKDLGPMMTEADRAAFETLEEHQNVYRTKGRQFLNITTAAQGQGQPQTAQMMHETICSAKTDLDLERKDVETLSLNLRGQNTVLILDWLSQPNQCWLISAHELHLPGKTSIL